MNKMEANSHVVTLQPKQGLMYDPPPADAAIPPAKHYAVFNAGREAITVIVTALTPAATS